MFYFNSIPPDRFALLAAIMGVLLALALTSEEKAALGNFIVSIGQTLLTAQAQEQNLQSINERENLRKEIEELSSRMEEIRRRLGC